MCAEKKKESFKKLAYVTVEVCKSEIYREDQHLEIHRRVDIAVWVPKLPAGQIPSLSNNLSVFSPEAINW